MKNRSSKTILVFLALGLISSAFCVQQAQAVPITGGIIFAGGVELNTSSAGTATAVTGWLDDSQPVPQMPTVVAASGSFAGLDNQTAIFASPWSFNSGPLPLLWQVGGFTFDLIASQIISQGFDPDGNGFVNVFGTGTITGIGFTPTFGTWFFSTQDPSANFVFSWSGGTEAVPDGGATVALLGLALAGIEGIRRRVRNTKS